MKHNLNDPIGCQCDSCRKYFAPADRFTDATFERMFPICKRVGCDHNFCSFDILGTCSGDCDCAKDFKSR